MVNIKYVLKRMKDSHFDYFVKTAKKIGRIEKKPWPAVLADMLNCTVKYGAGHVDYDTFRMYKMNKKERANLLTIAKNNELFKRLNDLNYIDVFEDKAKFDKEFNEFLNRDWFYIDDFKNVHYEAFAKFLEGKDKIIAKPLELCCGRGVHMIDLSEFDSMDAIVKHMYSAGTPLVEEVVYQCEEMASLCPTSINTVRIITILNGDNVTLVAGCVRMGRVGSVIDNFNNGGIAAILDVSTGTMVTDGYDKMRNTYVTHPDTGVKLKGFKVPAWEKIEPYLEKAAKKEPHVRYVGWDICIDKNYNLLLIEGNSFPGQDVTQYPELNLGTYSVMMNAIK